jgi:diguanylate cyclase (GGDEF)-like protein
VAPLPANPEDDKIVLKPMDLLDQLAQARAEVAQLKAQLELLRDQDPLTGLPNRMRLADRTDQAILRARRHGSMVAVLFLELDRFKAINQALDFAEADELCLQLTRRLTVLLGPGETLARVGTDQFAVLLPEVPEPMEPMKRAQTLLDAIRIPFRVGSREVRITASIGISVSPQDGDEAASLQKEAEQAANRARNAGGDAIQCTTLTLSEASFERQQMESYLGQAIQKNELQIFYQPQTTADGTIFGLEALLRWEHPVLGSVPPSKFVPLAEENQLIQAMGEWALATACRQAAIWQSMSPRPVQLSVNVSPLQLTHPSWVDIVARTLRESRLSPSCLELEITESTLLKNAKTNLATFNELRALGVHFGIDDFGTGYSSLSYLQRFPIDTLKIDQSFVRGMFPSQPGVVSSMPIVQTIVNLGRNMGMRVVAEGVETEQQKAALVAMECYGFQGYLMGRPMAAAELGLRLEAQIDSAFDALLPPQRLDPAN